MDKKKLTNYIIAGIIALVVIVVTVIWLTIFSLPIEKEPGDVIEKDNMSEETDLAVIEGGHESLMDSVQIDEDEQVIAVIIENHTEARRQQAGLSEASLVIEAEAEGGITRFLAFYPYQNIEKVGPVRSARPYYVRWAEMFNSALAHAGASDLGYSAIYSSGRVLDLDGLALEGGLKYFTRDYLYYAPHNLFTNLSELREKMDDRGWEEPLEDEIFKFGSSLDNQNGVDEPELADTVRIYYPFPQYNVRYDFDPENNVYERYQAGEKHVDKNTGDQIIPSNVVVMITNYYPTDEEGRLYMKTEGKGDMYLFRNGKIYPGTWKRFTIGDVLRFYGPDDEELVFEKGSTWISVINYGGGLQWE
ncbi:DUF3048 domain-containing protein [Patescibacteria group bacterium]